VAKVLQEKKTVSAFLKAKLILIRGKKDKGQSKTFEIKHSQKGKNVALEILK
jgi:hypothetical protein